VQILALLFLLALSAAHAEVRIGIVGGQGEVAIVFTQMLNDSAYPDFVAGARVVAAFRDGRMDKAGEDLRSRYRVDITPDIGSLCRRVDAVIFGPGPKPPPAEQIKIVAAAMKPMFIWGPIADTAGQARAVAKLSSGVPWFSASPGRFGRVLDLRGSYSPEVTAWGSAAAEMLYAVLGPGCEEVTSTSVNSIKGRWRDGRIGIVRPAQPNEGLGVSVIRSGVPVPIQISREYRGLLVEIVKFFENPDEPPVSNGESVEVIEFLDAAARSKAADGAPVRLR
jgi:hypothetical protein